MLIIDFETGIPKMRGNIWQTHIIRKIVIFIPVKHGLQNYKIWTYLYFIIKKDTDNKTFLNYNFGLFFNLTKLKTCLFFI